MYWVALRRADFVVVAGTTVSLTAEPVEGTALTLQRVDDVHGRDGLALGVLRVGDGISDDVLEEDLEHTASLFVDETGDTLHTSTSCQTANGRLRNALDVVSEHLPVAFGASLAESFASLSSARHFPVCLLSSTEMKWLMMIPGFNDILWQRRPLTSFDSCCFGDFLLRYSSVLWQSVGTFVVHCLPSCIFFFRYLSSVFYFLFTFFLFLEGIILSFFSNGLIILFLFFFFSFFPLFYISTFFFNLFFFVFFVLFFTRFST